MTIEIGTVPSVTFGVCCTGNIQGLLISLSSVLNGLHAPGRINLRMEGEFPAFANFYLEQLAAVASMRGCEFNITFGKSRGVRKARDWQLDNCRTEYLWMGDDDCLFMPNCLTEYLWAMEKVKSLAIPRTMDPQATATIGYINGSKPDVNNRRGYGDFSTKVLLTNGLENSPSMNQFYEGDSTLVRTKTMDTGNVLLYVTNLRQYNLRFDVFGKSYNSGGEDTLMGLQCDHNEAYGFFAPMARAVHLEKPNINFNEFAARGEMLRLACDQLNIDKAGLKEFMPFIKAQ